MYFFEIILILLSLSGLYVANKIRLEKKRGHKMICPLHGNCDDVLRSDFANIVGIPLELAGMAFYVTVILLNLLFIFVPALKFSLLYIILFGIDLFGFLFSVYLTSVQAFYIKNWCTWCLYSALVSIIIFIVASLDFQTNIIPLIKVMQANPWFFILVNIFAYALGTSLAIITEITTLRFLRDFKIDQKEKITLMYLWQALWSAIFLVIISSFAIYVFNLHVLNSTQLFGTKSAILGFIVIASAAMSLYFLPKLDKTKIRCYTVHVRSLSIHRNLAISVSTLLLVSWLINVFLYQIFYINQSVGKNLITYLIILITSIIVALFLFRYRDKKLVYKKSLDNQK